MATTTGNITQPNALSASSSKTAILCNGGSSTVTVSATGGTTPYTGTGTFSHAAGTYSYTVTDANSCTSTTTGTITQPSALTLSLQVTVCSSGNNGSIMATFGGGTAPYQVKIDAGAYIAATSPYTFTGLAAGSHTITVRDANGCTMSNSITVDPCSGNGVGTPGYWMNHPEAWCVPTIQLGCQSYTKAQAIAFMQQSTSKDMTYPLANQLIAAKLNVRCGGTDASCVSSAIAAADAFLCAHPVGSNVKASSSAWQQISPTYDTLVNYNEGKLCAPSRH
jgi:hypothetical protein